MRETEFRVLGKYSRIESGKGRVHYRPGDILKADPDTVKAFLDLLQPMQPIEKPEGKAIESRLVMLHRGGGRWVVENEVTHDVIHEGTLTKAEAKDLVEATGASPDKFEKDLDDKLDKPDKDLDDDKVPATVVKGDKKPVVADTEKQVPLKPATATVSSKTTKPTKKRKKIV